MKQKLHTKHYAVCLLLTLLFTVFLFTTRTYALTAATASLTTDRSSGTVTYTINGLEETAIGNNITIRATNETTKDTTEQVIALTEENCQDGTFNGTLSLKDMNYVFAKYRIEAVIGEDSIPVGVADFSIHTDKASLSISGNKGSAIRSAVLTSKEDGEDVLVPGSDNQVSVMVWNKSRSASTAVTVGKATALEGNHTWSIDVSKAGKYYGTWCAKVVVTNSKWEQEYVLASAEYKVTPTCTSFTAKKSSSLEKKKSFALEIKGLKNVFGIKSVNLLIKNRSGVQLATIKGTLKNSSGSHIYSTVTMKKVRYNLDLLTIQAVIVDKNGKTYTLSKKATADQRIKKGSLTVTKKKNASCNYKMTGVYIPGNIKKIEYTLYIVKNGKNKKLGTYTAKASASKKSYSATVKNNEKGKYLVKAYGYTNWGSKFLLAKKNFTLSKADLGKNGWFYEKYNGKTYKFYYVNNVKQTDLTKILGLKKSSSTNKNNFYVEVNRAASAVTVYMYNKDTKKYDTPIKTFSVCVGRDTSTNAGTSGLSLNSSYTPLGTYSVCTNGQSVKYTLKPMHEPDGSTVYARWTTHIVGNVYFHSIAVGSQSHYALPAYRYNLLGSPASAGCIRMAVADAKWIYDYTSTGNTVKIVKGNSKKPGPLGKAPTIKVKNGINYDPTDPAVPDSRKKADYKAGRISGYMTKKGVKVGY